MASSNKRPGKTAPRLISDLRWYDPRFSQASSSRQDAPYNPFIDPPPGYAKPTEEEETDNPLQCHHFFSSKLLQSLVPDGFSPLSGPTYRAAAICQKCLWHLDVTLHTDKSSSRQGPCPESGFPLHHFVHFDMEHVRDRQEEYYFECTACQAELVVCYRPPRLTAEYIALLTDTSILKARYDAAVGANQSRSGMQQQSGIKVLDALASYLIDSLDLTRPRRAIPALNKRFMLSLGDECATLLEWLGFTRSHNGVETVWELPNPPAPDPLAGENRRVLVEDVLEELWALLRKYGEDQKQTLKHPPPPPHPFDGHIHRLLGTVGYDRNNSRLRTIDLTQSNDEPYAGLGAVSDFSNDLLIYSFRRQVDYDPEASAYYYDCLATIAEKRQSEELNFAVATFASEGFVSRKDVIDAYAYFLLDPKQSANIQDSQIIGLFDARLENSPREQESELRVKLRILGKARNSVALLNSAENVFHTPEQALKWLDPSYSASIDIADEYVAAMAASKLAEQPDLEEACRRAVRIIAESRDSDSLRSWLLTGNTSSGIEDDEVTAAYKFFEIQDRTAELNPEVLETVVMARILDEPNREEEIRKHHQVLLRQTAPAVPNQPDYDHPVGLSNMGNTCYLNCLLQCFFTIKPLREIVLDFDRYKMDVSPAVFRAKKVGGRNITRQEVIKDQEFAQELRALFHDMATGPGPVVNPTWRLAGLALARDGNLQRRSTIGGDRPLLPLSPVRERPAPLHESDEDRHVLMSSQAASPDNASDITLIDSVPKTPESDKDDLMGVEGGPTDMGIGERSESPHDIERYADTEDPMEIIPLLSGSPPTRPPPVPPRPQVGTKRDADGNGKPSDSSWRERAETAANQQDVTEVMENVLFKLQCAMTPESLDSDGVQKDMITDLFFGAWTWNYLDKKIKDKAEPFSVIFLTLTQKPSDIYAALDNFFDIHTIDIDNKPVKRFGTVTQLPSVLQIYFQRQDFDIERSESYVIKHHVKLDEIIYMDRYMSSSSPELQKRREESWNWKLELARLQEYRLKLSTSEVGLTVPDALDATWQFVSEKGEELGADMAMRENLKAIERKYRDELTALDERISRLKAHVDEQFAEFVSTPYRLAAVFVHRGRGGTKGGHYWIYIHDFLANVWRRYEDREVTEVEDPSDIFRESDPESQGAPYFLVYVREGERMDLVDALCRMRPDEPVQDAILVDTRLGRD